MQRFSRFGAALLTGLLLLTACGTAPTATPPPATPPPATATQPPAAPATSTAPPAAAATATLASATATITSATATTAGATATAAPSGALQTVRLALDWTPNTNHTGFYVALRKGWYKDAGIDLRILPYSDAASPDALVAAGQAELGISFVEQVVIDRAAGLPVKSVAAIVQHNTSELATLQGSGLDRPAKLAGTRYAGFGSPYEEPVIATVLKCDGAQNTQFQNITTNTAGLEAIETKQADFVWIYKGWEAIQARHDGVALNEFLIRDFCVPDYPSPVIIASESFLAGQSDLGKRFMAVTSRGFQYAIQNPADAAALLIAANPAGTFPDPSLVQESAQYLAGQYQAEAPRWGAQTLQQWTGYPQFMVQTGKLEDANHQPVTQLDYASLFTNDLLPGP